MVELNSLKDDFHDQIYLKLKDKVEKLKRKRIEKETQIKSITKQQIPDKRKQLKEIVKKEQKLYLWDWSIVPDLGPRFENFVASQLLKY